jgi:hypothetical protein
MGLNTLWGPENPGPQGFAKKREGVLAGSLARTVGRKEQESLTSTTMERGKKKRREKGNETSDNFLKEPTTRLFFFSRLRQRDYQRQVRSVVSKDVGELAARWTEKLWQFAGLSHSSVLKRRVHINIAHKHPHGSFLPTSRHCPALSTWRRGTGKRKKVRKKGATRAWLAAASLLQCTNQEL